MKTSPIAPASKPLAPDSTGEAGRAGARALSTPSPSTRARLGAFVLLALGLAGLFFVLNFVITHPEGTLDFAHLYTAATILRQGKPKQLYDLSLQKQIERTVNPNGEFLPSFHTPFEMLVYWPFAYLPYRWAFLAWAGLNLLVLGNIFALIRRTGYRLETGSRMVWLALCLPLVAGNLALGQDGLLLALVFLFGFLAMKNGREFAGGVLLGIGLFRFEILLPFAFVFLLRRRWKFFGGFVFSGGVELLISWLMIGWSGLVNYAEILLVAGRVGGGNVVSSDVGAMPSLRGAVVTLFQGMVPASLQFPVVLVGTLALLGVAAWKFRSIDRPSDPAYDLQFSLCVVAALLSSYHLFTEVCTPLIVAGYLVLGYEDGARRGEPLTDHKGTMLLLLFALGFIVLGVFGFREWSVLFVVLLGMWAWLVRELNGLRTAGG